MKSPKPITFALESPSLRLLDVWFWSYTQRQLTALSKQHKIPVGKYKADMVRRLSVHFRATYPTATLTLRH